MAETRFLATIEKVFYLDFFRKIDQFLDNTETSGFSQVLSEK